MQAKETKPDIEAIYPLGFLQQALLFHSLQRESDEGFLQVRCNLNGSIELDSFEKAWIQIINRHESLRTSIHWENIEKPVQLVRSYVELPLSYQDWTHHLPKVKTKKLSELVNNDRNQNLDLTKSPVFRVNLIKLSDTEYFLLWTLHHILADGWTASIILNDLLVFYYANKKGEEPDLPPVPSHKSYINWLKSLDKSKAGTFWENELRGFKFPTIVGKRNLRNSDEGTEFEIDSFALSGEESERLRSVCKKNRITLNTLIQGIWSILLSKFLDSEDVVFGTIASGRSIALPNAELMAGMLMTMLPLRVKLDSEQDLSDWLNNIQIRQLKIRKYDYVNLDEVLSWSKADTPNLLFDNIVIFQNIPLANIVGGDIRISDFKSGLTSNYALTLAVKPSKEIEFFLKFDSFRISKDQVRWFRENLSEICQQLIENTPQTLGEILNLIPACDQNDNRSEMLEAKGPVTVDYVAPQNEIELKLTKIWERLLGQSPIGLTDDLFEIGGTSITAIRLLAEIDRDFERKLQPMNLLQNKTIKSLSKLIENKNNDEQFSTLVPLRASGSKPPIYCLHAGGGHVFFYRYLAKYLGNEQPVYAIQRLGLDDVAQAAQDIDKLAAHYVSDIRKAQPKGPYSLLAYCFGTTICWEMVKILQRLGESVSLVAIVDSPPFYRDMRTTNEKIERVSNKLKQMDLSFVKTAWQGRIMHPLRQKWKYLTGGQTEKERQNLMRALNSKAESYVWEPLPVKVSLLRSDSMLRLPEQNEAVKEWDRLALGGVETFNVGGNHDVLFEEPSVKKLATQLEKCLRAANPEK